MNIKMASFPKVILFAIVKVSLLTQIVLAPKNFGHTKTRALFQHARIKLAYKGLKLPRISIKVTYSMRSFGIILFY